MIGGRLCAVGEGTLLRQAVIYDLTNESILFSQVTDSVKRTQLSAGTVKCDKQERMTKGE